MGNKRSFRSEVRPNPARPASLVQRLMLAALVAQALAACDGNPVFRAVEKQAEHATRFGGCVLDDPPRPSDLLHPSTALDRWSECANPRVLRGNAIHIATPPPSYN